MQIVLSQPDGIHLPAQALLQELAEDETLHQFGGGLVSQALSEPGLLNLAARSLAETLHQPELSAISALVTPLLVLDGEIQAFVDGEKRIFSLPGFFGYRSRLPLDKFPLSAVRLPPLNPDGRYFFSSIAMNQYLAARMDIHPTLKIAGHVRVAISNPKQLPQRLEAIEGRLERQVLEDGLIEMAVDAGRKTLVEPLGDLETAALINVLKKLRDSVIQNGDFRPS